MVTSITPGTTTSPNRSLSCGSSRKNMETNGSKEKASLPVMTTRKRQKVYPSSSLSSSSAVVVGRTRFSKQADAFSYADSFGGLPVFSREFVGRSGQREFFVTSWKDMFCWLSKELNKTPSLRGMRTQYEMIRENRPCHMYVDAEYSKELNPDLDSNTLRIEIEKRVKEEIKLVLSTSKNPTIQKLRNDPNTKLEIEVNISDASTDKKESKHFCFQIFYKTYHEKTGELQKTTPLMFADNSHCQSLMLALEAKAVKNEKETCLIVKGQENGKEERMFYADMAVYTKNRNWRMPWCTKAGQNRPLLPFLPKGDKVGDGFLKLQPDIMLEEFFYKNLVTFITPSSEPLLLLEVNPSPYRIRRTVDMFLNHMSALISRSGLSESGKFIIDQDNILVFNPSSSSSYSSANVVEENDSQGPESAEKMIPVRDVRRDAPPRRLVSILNKLAPGEQFYCWREYLDSGVIHVSSTSRYCQVHGYEHRSNHIRYKLFSETGSWLQCCYHGGARSKLLPLSEDLKEEIQIYYENDRCQTQTNLFSLFSTTQLADTADGEILRKLLLEVEERQKKETKEKKESPTKKTCV